MQSPESQEKIKTLSVLFYFDCKTRKKVNKVSQKGIFNVKNHIKNSVI